MARPDFPWDEIRAFVYLTLITSKIQPRTESVIK